jgi:endonuclease/exonuclease/phosphatase family metal-dependent hydrolase
MRSLLLRGCWLVLSFFMLLTGGLAETFRVATYNLENYLESPIRGRGAKSLESKTKIRDLILSAQPDVIALQEVGGPGALNELQASIKSGGLDLPYSEIVTGFDTNIQNAVLSRFEITARRPHTNDNFLLRGRRFRVTRGFCEVDIKVNSNYAFTLLAAHLKSKRATAQVDEQDMRLEEAKILREIVETRMASAPTLNLIVLGDFNDSKDSPPLRTILGRGRLRLIDTRPAEPNGDESGATNGREERAITWTHYFAREDSYNRIDYILLSPAMALEWMAKGTQIVTVPDWGIASDHRPVVAAFQAQDRTE